MAKKLTLEELNERVARLAADYKDANEALEAAIRLMGDDQESRDRVKAATAAKQKIYAAYTAAKKKQLAMRNKSNE